MWESFCHRVKIETHEEESSHGSVLVHLLPVRLVYSSISIICYSFKSVISSQVTDAISSSPLPPPLSSLFKRKEISVGFILFQG